MMLHSLKQRPSEKKADGGMKHIVSEIRSTSEVLHHRRSLQVFLRPVGFVSLLLVLSFIFSSGSPSALASSQSTARRTSAQPPGATFSYVDIVLIIDNVGEISTYDPVGARFVAAQMFVNQAQYGSRIGVVRITSSDKPSPTTLLNLTTIRNDNDKAAVRQMLKQSLFGEVDPGPTAYFVPALHAAGQMLLSAHDNNYKYIVMITDSLAQSGDKERCSSAPDQYHRWFCQIPTLQREQISVILFGLTTPTNQGISRSLQHYLEQYGGMALQVG